MVKVSLLKSSNCIKMSNCIKIQNKKIYSPSFTLPSFYSIYYFYYKSFIFSSHFHISSYFFSHFHPLILSIIFIVNHSNNIPIYPIQKDRRNYLLVKYLSVKKQRAFIFLPVLSIFMYLFQISHSIAD